MQITVLGNEDKAVNKTKCSLSWNFHYGEGRQANQKHVKKNFFLKLQRKIRQNKKTEGQWFYISIFMLEDTPSKQTIYWHSHVTAAILKGTNLPFTSPNSQDFLNLHFPYAPPRMWHCWLTPFCNSAGLHDKSPIQVLIVCYCNGVNISCAIISGI